MSGSASYTDFPSLQVVAPTAPNLLEQANQAVNLKSQMNQNKLFGAQQAQSQLLTQNTNPDGQINIPGYQAAVAADPAASSVGAGDAFAQAQHVNQTSLENTNMTLHQHFDRLSRLAGDLESLNIANNGAGIPAATMTAQIQQAFQRGDVTAQEAASLSKQVSQDPQANAQTVRGLDAGIGNDIQAIAPHLIQLSNGPQTGTFNDNPGAAGGANVPGTVNVGLSNPQAAAPVSYTGANNQTVNTTQGGYAAATNTPTGGSFGPSVSMPPLAGQNNLTTPPNGTQNQLVPQAVQSAPLPTIGGPAPSAGAPAAPGITAIPGPAPGVADIQKANTTAYTSDQNDASNINPQISALTDLLAAAPSAGTGPEAEKTKYLSGLGQQLGITDDGSAATELAIIDKAQSQLVTNGLTGLGTATDAKMFEAAAGTPGKTMTPQAIAATGAMVLGNLLYKKTLGTIGQSLVTKTGSAVGYLAAKQSLQNQTSPLVLSLPYMPYAQRQNLQAYIKSLPGADRGALEKQVQWTQKHIWNAPSQ